MYICALAGLVNSGLEQHKQTASCSHSADTYIQGAGARMQEQAYTVGDTGLARLHLYEKIITDIYMALMESIVRWKWHHEYRLLQI